MSCLKTHKSNLRFKKCLQQEVGAGDYYIFNVLFYCFCSETSRAQFTIKFPCFLSSVVLLLPMDGMPPSGILPLSKKVLLVELTTFTEIEAAKEKGEEAPSFEQSAHYHLSGS